MEIAHAVARMALSRSEAEWDINKHMVMKARPDYMSWWKTHIVDSGVEGRTFAKFTSPVRVTISYRKEWWSDRPKMAA
jgi:hypothetical protein